MTTNNNYPLLICDSNLCPQASYRVPPFTPRRAIDPTGHFGSFYDAKMDRIIKDKTAPLEKTCTSSSKEVHCTILPFSFEEPTNVMETIHMHPSLRLSILLQMIPSDQMAASITYALPIDRFTRILHYTAITRTEYLSDDDLTKLIADKLSCVDALGTHVVILVNYGIDAAMILQLPNHDDQLVLQIDALLQRVCQSFEQDNCDVWTEETASLLQHVTHTQVFSNLPQLTECNSIFHFHEKVNQLRKSDDHPPYNYNLCPITHLFDIKTIHQSKYFEILPTFEKQIERHAISLWNWMKTLEKCARQDYSWCCQHLKHPYDDMMQEYEAVQRQNQQKLKDLRDLVYSWRGTGAYASKIDEIVNDPNTTMLRERIESVLKKFKAMELKETVLGELHSKRIEYRYIATADVGPNPEETVLHQKLLQDEQNVRILCGTDQLIAQHPSEWTRFITQLMDERQLDASLRLIYMDFTNTSSALQEFKILPSDEETFNILLLGESGVGKSTFINALVNYLRFDTFQQADHNKPIVLLPISFIVTTGHDFEEHHVTYPGIDAEHHEVHDQPGQSVTQHCRSYVFTISDEKERKKARKIRLIDSPGVGDVRGVDQDEKNMQEVLSYIEQLGYLHAVCIVMKPNVTRLTISFRLCLLQLLDLFGDAARNHLFFCFTNTRATFYSPGNTGYLLRQILHSLPNRNPISMHKQNTFCFDSESFRYLVARTSGVHFDSDAAHECRDTWERSSAESKRLLRCIVTRKEAYRISQDRQSIQRALREIRLLIRPILQVLRDELVQTRRPPDPLTPLHNERTITEIGASSHRIDTDATQLSPVVHQLREALGIFGAFYAKTKLSENDPILIEWQAIINAEKHADSQTSIGALGQVLQEELSRWKNRCQAMIDRQRLDEGPSHHLSTVYQWIDNLNQEPMVRVKINQVNKDQSSMCARHEFEVMIEGLHLD